MLYYLGMAEQAPHGNTILEWSFPEFADYPRGRAWYLGFFVLAAIMAGLAVLGRVYTAIPVIVLITLILILRFRRRPTEITARITDLGLEVADMNIRWEELREFWIVYRPPEIKKLYITFKTTLRQPFSIDLMNQNPLKVREALNEFLPENIAQESETASDQLLRMFKM